ncbi:MAG: DNA mismatch endonuclease Vsr [Sulfuricaulis sp.]|uniref:very short patch repair endonuclease n=1 Tax=Sulfuricaulis sp. TaxID=2003553 RepID=UPI0034A36472
MTPVERSVRMALIRSRDTTPEIAVRRVVHGMGYRYRLHIRELPGKPDLVFSSRRKIILVHGCFWHQHSDPACKITRKPKSNTGYWTKKLKRNVARDSQHSESLSRLGWKVLTVWECELRDKAALSKRLRRFLA